jgi:hypothetical protein
MGYTGYFIDYLRALDVKMSSKNTKMLLIVDQCAAHPQDTSYLKNMKICFISQIAPAFFNDLSREIITLIKHYHNQLVRKSISVVGLTLLHEDK